MSEKDSYKNDQNIHTNNALLAADPKAPPRPHPGSVLGLSIASAVWYFYLLYKIFDTKDITRWIYLSCFCLSCLILSFNAAEQVQLLTNFFPASRSNQALTTTKKQAHQKLFLINAYALPIGLYTFALSTEYSENFDKEAKTLLIGFGSLLFIAYVVILAVVSQEFQ